MLVIPHLPDELKLIIISMVEDVDIRRYFRVYNKIDTRKYKILEKLIPEKIYYRWSCKDDCPEECERHEYPHDFNPIITPVASNHYSHIPAVVWKMVNNKWKLVERNSKTVGKYNVYDIKYNLPNIIESDERVSLIPYLDTSHIEIQIYNNDSPNSEFDIWNLEFET